MTTTEPDAPAGPVARQPDRRVAPRRHEDVALHYAAATLLQAALNLAGTCRTHGLVGTEGPTVPAMVILVGAADDYIAAESAARCGVDVSTPCAPRGTTEPRQ